MFDPARPMCTVLCFVLVVTFDCFCVSVRCGPISVTGGLHRGSNNVPNLHPNGPASSCVAEMIDGLALINTLFLNMVTLLPVLFNMMAKVGNLTLNNASVLVIMGITLSAMERLRSRVVVHRRGNFLRWCSRDILYSTTTLTSIKP